MKYYLCEYETDGRAQNTAGIKARVDAERIFINMGFKPINIEIDGYSGKLKKITSIPTIYSQMKKKLAKLQSDDWLFIQFPLIHHTIGIGDLLHSLKEKGIKTVLLIHDLDMLRKEKAKSSSFLSKLRIRLEEPGVLRNAAFCIVHNEMMKKELIDFGIVERGLICLGIFDYLKENNFNDNISQNAPIIIAGSLRPFKSGYIYNLPPDIEFNLYGVGYEGNESETIKYKGAFMPEKLVFIMEGSYGLVWDGDTSSTCAGPFGEYLKINNPHKTSLYISAGIPVIIWEKAALASFITENNLGIVISSLEDIKYKVNSISKEEYANIVKSVREMGEKLSKGYFLTLTINKLLEQ